MGDLCSIFCATKGATAKIWLQGICLSELDPLDVIPGHIVTDRWIRQMRMDARDVWYKPVYQLCFVASSLCSFGKKGRIKRLAMEDNVSSCVDFPLAIMIDFSLSLSLCDDKYMLPVAFPKPFGKCIHSRLLKEKRADVKLQFLFLTMGQQADLLSTSRCKPRSICTYIYIYICVCGSKVSFLLCGHRASERSLTQS